jgi:hypothetical protein
VKPGQKPIVSREGPFNAPVDGCMTAVRPNLARADGSISHVAEIHLHHRVWLVNGPILFAGEAKRGAFRVIGR